MNQLIAESPVLTSSIQVKGAQNPGFKKILTPEALDFLAELHARFNSRRLSLLEQRKERQQRINNGEFPEFQEITQSLRDIDWKVSPAPACLQDRRVEITGPVDRKMIINALNAPVRAFMADFEDSCSPTWDNIIRGQVNLADAVRRSISFSDPATGKVYRLAERTATL